MYYATRYDVRQMADQAADAANRAAGAMQSLAWEVGDKVRGALADPQPLVQSAAAVAVALLRGAAEAGGSGGRGGGEGGGVGGGGSEGTPAPSDNESELESDASGKAEKAERRRGRPRPRREERTRERGPWRPGPYHEHAQQRADLRRAVAYKQHYVMLQQSVKINI